MTDAYRMISSFVLIFICCSTAYARPYYEQENDLLLQLEDVIQDEDINQLSPKEILNEIFDLSEDVSEDYLPRLQSLLANKGKRKRVRCYYLDDGTVVCVKKKAKYGDEKCTSSQTFFKGRCID
ncbi:uncharacterized protein LOC130646299 [Hydractinia symbiolongicarpus]|uniref:uncharacterized protein LOC130646299 n=1 Tax=Hydractinia symbiolongicarpus TaxID=13093 RepID=UPI00254F0D4A|nr:uncharacterized protein LOC130646299 [Hydractinia symbiolongicarpus]